MTEASAEMTADQFNWLHIRAAEHRKRWAAIGGERMTEAYAVTDYRDAMSQTEVLIAWNRSKQDLKLAKETEMKWRKYVVKRAFPQATEGTNTVELNNGYALKAVVSYNYNLLDNEIVETTLDKIKKIGNQGAFVADRLVSVTYNFLVSEYRKLQEEAATSIEAKEILRLCNEMLVIKDAAPKLDIKEPKGKK